MMNLFLTLFLGILTSTLFFGQEKTKEIRSFQLENYLNQYPNSEEIISLFVKGNKQEIAQQLTLHKGQLKGSINGWYFIAIPTKNTASFLSKTQLVALNFRNYKGVPLNDTMRVNNRINAIHSGLQPLGTAYDGEGIIMGFIDTGIDWKHPDFLNPTDSSTRILALWDQTKPINSFTPSKYGYGQDWDSSEIMQGLSTNNDQYGHGSTVAGTGCGNAFANGLNKGVAPKAELIVVESNFNAPNWLGTIADAVEYIYHLADSLGKPCVINASLGTYLGSHDGLDPYALYIDSLINRKKGHLFVASAGNSGDWGKYHLYSEVNSDTAITWFKNNPTSGLGGPAVFFEVWADTADFNNIDFTIGIDKVSPQFSQRGKGNYVNIATNLGSVNYDTIRNSNHQQLATVQYWSELRDGQYLLQVYLPNPDSSHYNFRFETVGTGKYDCWSTSALGMSDIIEYTNWISNFTEAQKYVNPDSLKTIVSSFQCSPSVITVGNYYNDSGYVNLDSTWTQNGGVRGALAENSSKGPTRDNRLKPEIAASGHGTNAALPLSLLNYYKAHPTLDSTLAIGGMHRRNGGTSMSSPVVAGVGALLLEKCNNISVLDFKNALITSAYADNYTGTLPNYAFGYGKLDGFNTLLHFKFQNTLSGDLAFCNGDSSLLTITNEVVSYNWNNTSTAETILVDSTEQHYLITIDSLGCASDTLHFQTIANPSPIRPNLIQSSDSILAANTNGNTLVWYLDDDELPFAIDSAIYITQNGMYYVTASNSYGCSASSDTIYYNTVGLEELRSQKALTYPIPTHDYLTIKAIEPISALEISDINGKVVIKTDNINQRTIVINTLKLANGVYSLKLITSQKTDVQKIVIQH